MSETEPKRLHKAIILLITSALFFSFMNMFVNLSGDVPTVQKTFFRNFFALIVASGVMIKKRRASSRKRERGWIFFCAPR